MRVIGRMNNQNARWAIDALARSLTHAVKELGIPATVSHSLNPVYPWDVAIRPLPGARFGSVSINSMYWTKTDARGDGGIYFCREMNGWRAWPGNRPDRVVYQRQWILDDRDPYGQRRGWLCVVTRALAPDGAVWARWVPMSEVWDWYNRGPSIPLGVIAGSPSVRYNEKTKRFELTSDLLATVLGVKGWAS